MTEPAKPAFEFSITIDDVVLDKTAIEQIEKKLAELMMEELAKIDLAGNLVTEPLPTARDFGEPGGGLTGFHMSRE